jgi:hypothetical protein
MNEMQTVLHRIKNPSSDNIEDWNEFIEIEQCLCPEGTGLNMKWTVYLSVCKTLYGSWWSSKSTSVENVTKSENVNENAKADVWHPITKQIH